MNDPFAAPRRPVRTLATVLVFALSLALLWTFVVTPLRDAGAGASAPAPLAAPAPATPVAQQEDVIVLPVETYEIFLARDPFEPLFPAVPPPADPTDPGVPPPSPDPNASPSPPPGVDPKDEPDCRQNAELVCEGRVVSLVDISVQDGVERATIRVDTQLFTVGEGAIFAEHFRVLSIDRPCVVIQFGDSMPTLCLGDSARVLK